MLGYALLPGFNDDDTAATASAASKAAAVSTARAVWLLLLLVPGVCVALQSLLWTFYSLRGAYLKQVKMPHDDARSGSSGDKNDSVALDI
jgi:hypothetical protein